jgi:hypothetical protein
MLQTKLVEKIKTHIWCSITFLFFRKSCRLWDIVEKYCTAGQSTDDNMTDAHWMLDKLGYNQTIRICNNYCFSTATSVVQTSQELCYTFIDCLVNYYKVQLTSYYTYVSNFHSLHSFHSTPIRLNIYLFELFIFLPKYTRIYSIFELFIYWRI